MIEIVIRNSLCVWPIVLIFVLYFGRPVFKIPTIECGCSMV